MSEQHPRALMPEENAEHQRINFGGFLDALFHRNRKRPTLYFALPGEKEQLGRLDPFGVAGIPHGHYHALPRTGADDQVPFDDSEVQIPFQLALGYMQPLWFRKILDEAGEADLAMRIPDGVIEAAAAQYKAAYEGLRD